MKTLPLLASSVVLLGLTHAAETGKESLERRCAEQERQIHQLELENSRLRSLLASAPATATVSTPAAATIETAAIGTEPVAKPATPAPPAAAERFHTVGAGDTLTKIARKHDTSVAKLVDLNGLKDAGLIVPGQKLKLPALKAPARAQAEAAISVPAETPEAAAGTHTVKAGETFFSIARKYGLSPDSLAGANPGIDPRSLKVGQTLRLASGATTAATPAPRASTPVSNRPIVRTVSIEEEITFADFAAKYGTTTDKLNALNGLSLEPNTVLAKGSELYVSAQP